MIEADKGIYNNCFGCGESHPFGLRMSFDAAEDGTVTAEFRAHELHGGAPGIIHGGIQAAMLDEAAGFACHTLDPPGEWRRWVTMTMDLRFRRPVPTELPVTVTGKVTATDGDDAEVRCVIALPDGTEATVATARWRCLGSTDPG